MTDIAKPATPKGQIVSEKIGGRDWEFRKVRLDVHDEVSLWSDNPRLQSSMMDGVSSQAALESKLRESAG